MMTFIAQYWLEFLFGLIAAAAGFLAKKFYSLYKNEQERLRNEEDTALKNSINKEILDVIQDHKEQSYERNEELQDKINDLSLEIETLREGILSLHGKSFMNDCKKLLDVNHVITPEEWDFISLEHQIYNSLKGNHDGDRLYEDVKIKYHNNLE